MAGEGYWVVRTYEAGSVGEKTKFWIQGSRKSSRKEKLSIKKQEQNEYAAVKRLARLINANFSKGDLLLGLDYSAAGMDRLTQWVQDQKIDCEDEGAALDAIRSAAVKQVELVIRRVKRELGKQDLDLRYISVTSDMDGDTGEFVRVHHHLLVPAFARDAFVMKWKELGGVDWSELSDQEDYTPIAEYLLRQVRRIPDKNKYKTSRNLIRPVPKDRVVASGAELRVPQGGKLLHRNEYKPGRPQYIRYVLPEGRRGPRRSPA